MKKYFYASLISLLVSSGCKKEESPKADFTYSGTLQNFTPIQFNNSSTGAQTYQWEFSDDSVPVLTPQPTHVFKQAGTYSVSLTATGLGGKDIKRQSITVAQADTAALISEMVAGKYRFTKLRTSCYGYGCLGGNVSACDVVMTVAKVGKGLQIDNLMPVLSIINSTTKEYRFFVLRAASAANYYQARFKKDTDSLEFSNGSGGTGGGSSTTYYGKKL